MADNPSMPQAQGATPGPSRYAWPAGLALAAAGAVLILQLFVFRGDSITNDENSYVFQAKILAAGRTWAPTPPERNLAQFPSSMINLTRTRWFSRYPFGHPLALVPGVVAGYLLLTPLLMAAGSVLLIYTLGRQLYDEPRARVAAALAAVSPFFLAMHGTLLSHTSALFFLSLFAAAYVRMFDSPRIGWGLLAGASLGYAFNVRPFTAVLVSWPFVLWGLWRFRRSRAMLLVKPGMAFALAFGAFLGAYLLYNHLTTESWKISPYSYYNPSEGLGFGRVMVSDAFHTPERGLRHTLTNLRRLNGWWLGLPDSLAVLGGLLVARWRWREVVLLLSGVSLIVGYFFFWFTGITTVGPVYYFEAVLPLSLLGAHSLVSVWQKWPWVRRWGLHVRVLVASAAVLVFSAYLAQFWRDRVPRLSRTFAEQRALARAVEATKPRNAVIFLETGGPVWQAVRYDPLAPLDIIYARSRRNSDDRIMQQNPDRQIYRYRNRWLERIR